jgi:hypothetical protein
MPNAPAPQSSSAGAADQPDRTAAAQAAETAPAAATKRPRRWLLRLLLGVTAFVVGGALAIVLLAPVLLNRLGPGWIEAKVGREVAGSVDVENLRIGWTGRQRLAAQLMDLRGTTLGSLNLDLAPFSSWVRSRGQDWGENRLRFDLHLVVDQQGRLNLREALRPRTPTAESTEGEVSRSGSAEWPPRLVLVLEPSELTFLDQRPGAVEEVRLTELTGRVEFDGAVVRGELRGQLQAPQAGQLAMTFVQRPDGDSKATAGSGLQQVQLDIEAAGIPTALVEALVGSEGLLSSVFGEQLALQVDFSGASDRGALALSEPWNNAELTWNLTGPAGQSQQSLSINSAGLTLAAGGHHWTTGAGGLLDSLSQPDPAASVEPNPWQVSVGGGRSELEFERLTLPAEAFPPSGLDWKALGRSVAIACRARLPVLRLERGITPGAAGAATSFALEQLELDLSAGPGQAPRMTLGGLLTDATAESGFLHGSAELGALEGLWSEFDAGHVRLLSVQVEIEQAPAAMADALLSSAGLLRDVLGQRFDFQLSAPELDVPLAKPLEALGGLELHLESPNCSAALAGNLSGGSFTTLALPAPPGSVRFTLNDLASQRLASGLMPLLAGVRSHSPTDRAVLEFQDLQLPLNGDLSQLSGNLRLDLGRVDGGLLGPLAQLWPAAARYQDQRFQPLELTIAAGRVRYQGWTLRIGDYELPLSGDYSLLDGNLSLDARLPLAAIGGDLGRALEQARRFLPADTAVPLRISGQPNALGLSLAPEAGAILAAAARQALEAQALEALGGKIPDLPGGLEGVLDPSKLPAGLGDLLEQLKKKKSGG